MARADSASAETRRGKSRAALRAAMLALLAEKPFDQIRITDLTARAGIGYATFFRHHSGTEDVLNEIAGDQIRELLDLTIPVLHQFDSRASILALCRYVHDRRQLWRTLLTGGAAHAVRGEFVRQARDWASRVRPERQPPVPIDLGTICSAGSTIDALAWWLEQGEQACPVEEIAGYIVRLTIAPFIGKG